VLDDIQWCEVASLSLIESILHEEDLENIFLITTCRAEYLPRRRPDEEGSAMNHDLVENNLTDTGNGDKVSGPLVNDAKNNDHTDASNGDKVNWSLSELVGRHSKQIHILELPPLDVASVQKIVDCLLNVERSSQDTRSLAEIVHRKTQGNPFFVTQFMLVLVEENVLTFDQTSQLWNWLELDIRSFIVADNVAKSVYKRLENLKPADLFLAQVAACISRTVETKMLVFVLSGLKYAPLEKSADPTEGPSDITESLDRLFEMGIIEAIPRSGKFGFAHDQIQHLACQLLSQHEKVSLKTAIGLRLIEGMDEVRRENLLLTAVELCSFGVDVMSPKEQKSFAFWAFLAGDASLRQGAYKSALKFFKLGLHCLGNNPFQADAELALPLYSGCAEAAFCYSDFDTVESCIKVVKEQDGIPGTRKIRVVLIELKYYTAKRMALKGVAVFRETMKSLDCGNFPSKPGMLSVIYHLYRTSATLKKYDKDKLLALPVCRDQNIYLAMNVFAESIVVLYLASPNLFVLATCKAIHWSLTKGLTKTTAQALTVFAAILVGMNDNLRAVELSETALELCDTFKEALPYTIGTTFGFVRHWSRPMQQFEGPTKYAIVLAERLGMVDMITYNYNTYGAMMMLTQGGNLPGLIEELQGFCRNMDVLKTYDKGIECILQFVLKLVHPCQDRTSLNGDVMNEEVTVTFANENQDILLPKLIEFLKMSLMIHFGHPVEASVVGTNILGFGVNYAQGVHYATRCSFMIGIANALAYGETRKMRNLRIANKMHKRLQVWLKHGNPNVPHFVALLEAELYSIRRTYVKAKSRYESAISTSRRAGYKLDCAFALQRYSLFCLRMDRNQARYYMKEALRGYTEYGAEAVAAHLEDTYADLLIEG
jgi:predicted ATPase